VVADGAAQEGDLAGDSGDDSEVDRDCGLGNAKALERYAAGVAEAAAQQEREGGGDKKKGGASKGKKGVAAWLTSIVPPSKANAAVELSALPPVSLSLDFAHGARCGDVRNAVRYNACGDVVFPAAALGVIYTASSHAQQFHTGHRGEVVALAVDAHGLAAATGDGGGEVRVWDASTGKVLCALPRFHVDGISQLAFSPDGRWLASVGGDEFHTVTCPRFSLALSLSSSPPRSLSLFSFSFHNSANP
jgi:microtubule-associated protein-like 6